nr:hypothetical protein [Streptomyces sp. SID5476]
MLVAGVSVAAVLVLNRFDWNADGLLASAPEGSGQRAAGWAAPPSLPPSRSALHVWGTTTATLALLPFAIAASAMLPSLLHGLFWRGFTARGLRQKESAYEDFEVRALVGADPR